MSSHLAGDPYMLIPMNVACCEWYSHWLIRLMFIGYLMLTASAFLVVVLATRWPLTCAGAPYCGDHGHMHCHAIVAGFKQLLEVLANLFQNNCPPQSAFVFQQLYVNDYSTALCCTEYHALILCGAQHSSCNVQEHPLCLVLPVSQCGWL